MIQSYLSAAAYNGKGIEYGEQKWYQVNWASGMTGMIYNEDRLTALGFDVPNTSDELVAIMRDVKAVLRRIAGERTAVAFADVTSVFQAVNARKRFIDYTSNNVNHPGDYGHRLYAQTLYKTVVGD